MFESLPLTLDKHEAELLLSTIKLALPAREQSIVKLTKSGNITEAILSDYQAKTLELVKLKHSLELAILKAT